MQNRLGSPAQVTLTSLAAVSCTVEPVKKKLPASSMTVGKLKQLCKRLFKVDTDQQVLCFVFGTHVRMQFAVFFFRWDLPRHGVSLSLALAPYYTLYVEKMKLASRQLLLTVACATPVGC